jgi:SAM-dependent methyltransferase
MSNNAERDWQKWGAENPYFGVVSSPKYLKNNLTEQTREEFFQSGEGHVQNVYSVIQSKVRPGFQASRVLDFGCGVGRLLIPFANRAQTAFGVDISSGMLAEAEKNCSAHGVQGVQLLHASEIDRIEAGSIDLVHSYIVFQHIPVSEGERLLRKLISLIAQGGIGAIHITFSNGHSSLRRAALAVRSRSRSVHGLLNGMQGKPLSLPLMQMNSYSMNRVMDILVESHCSNVHLEFTDHDGFRGAMFYFEKTDENPIA